jgi:hypothetical protein
VLGVAAIGMIVASYYANSYALNSMPFRVREVTDFDFDFDFNTQLVHACARLQPHRVSGNL